MLEQAAEKQTLDVLHELNLSNSVMGVKGACNCLKEVLCSSRVLRKLDISDNAITGSDACDMVQGLYYCSSLEEIYAAHNGFGGEDAASALRELLQSPNACPKLKILDLSFNRFRGSRVGQWPEHYRNSEYYAHVLRILDSLLPMLLRFSDGQDPALLMHLNPHDRSVNHQILRPKQLDLYRNIYKDLAVILDEQLATMSKQMNSNSKICPHGQQESKCYICSTFGGTVTHLLAGLSDSLEQNSKPALTHLLLTGNFFTNEISGTILHVVSKLTRVTCLSIDYMDLDTKTDGKVHCTVNVHRDQEIPRSTFSLDGFSVLSVQSRRMLLDCGFSAPTLHQGATMALSHYLETGLRNNEVEKEPAQLTEMPLYNKFASSFLPSAQLAFENEIISRVMYNSHTSSKSNYDAPPLSVLLLNYRNNVMRLKAKGKEVLEHPEVAASLSNLGTELMSEGRHAEAATRFEQSLAIYIKIHGAEHPDVASTLKNLTIARKLSKAEAVPVTEPRSVIKQASVLPALNINHPCTRPRKIGATESDTDAKTLPLILLSKGTPTPKKPPRGGGDYQSLRTSLSPKIAKNQIKPPIKSPIPPPTAQISKEEENVKNTTNLEEPKNPQIEVDQNTTEEDQNVLSPKQAEDLDNEQADLSLVSPILPPDPPRADPKGDDAFYTHHATLPTFACAERFEIQSGPADFFFMLHQVKEDGSYGAAPSFLTAKGSPSIEQTLSSLRMRGDIMSLASVAAAKGKIDIFWDTVTVIREVCAVEKYIIVY